MKKSVRRPLSKAEKRLFLFSGTAILLLVGIGYFNLTINAEPIIDYPVVPPRPNPNGYDLYMAAAKATVRFRPEVDAINDLNAAGIDSKILKQRYSLLRRQAWLKANSKAFGLIEKATKSSTMMPDQRGNYTKGSRDSNEFRQLEKDIAVRGRTFQLMNKPFEAAQSALDGIQMGCGITKGGVVINYLIGLRAIANSRSILEDSNRTINQLNAVQCKTLSKRLETMINVMPGIDQSLEEERWATLRHIQGLKLNSSWSQRPPGASWKDQLRLQLVSKRAIIANLNQSFNDTIALSKKPYSQTNGTIFQGNDYMSVLLLPITAQHLKKMEARSKVGLELLLLRFALRAYKIENGTYPSSLSLLAPRYLKTIPTDDYGDDRPYFYRITKGNYELWSVGSDGKNDNGKPLPRKKGSANSGLQVLDLFQSGDYVAGKNR